MKAECRREAHVVQAVMIDYIEYRGHRGHRAQQWQGVLYIAYRQGSGYPAMRLRSNHAALAFPNQGIPKSLLAGDCSVYYFSATFGRRVGAAAIKLKTAANRSLQFSCTDYATSCASY